MVHLDAFSRGAVIMPLGLRSPVANVVLQQCSRMVSAPVSPIDSTIRWLSCGRAKGRRVDGISGGEETSPEPELRAT